MAAAVNVYRTAQASGQTPALRTIAKAHGVPRQTLADRLHGKQSMSDFNTAKQLLSLEKESVLVQFILESADTGFGLERAEIEALALAAIQTKKPGVQLGNSWYFNFLDRHHAELQPHWSKPLDTQQAKSLNPVAVRSWFEIVEKYIVKLGIPPELVYGMDESGFPSANTGKVRVVGARGTRIQHRQGKFWLFHLPHLFNLCRRR